MLQHRLVERQLDVENLLGSDLAGAADAVRTLEGERAGATFTALQICKLAGSRNRTIAVASVSVPRRIVTSIAFIRTPAQPSSFCSHHLRYSSSDISDERPLFSIPCL